MKLSKLFVLGAMGLVSLSAGAYDFENPRTMPEPPGKFAATPVAFQADKHYVLYNTGKGEYFSQGGSWGSKAQSCPEEEYANVMYFTKNLVNGEWDGKTYIFKIYSTVRSTTYSWHECFFDSDVAMFVDRGSQANYFWEIEDMGSNVYRLKAADANPAIHSDGLYVGCPTDAVPDETNLDANRDYGTIVPLSPKTSENIDWVFYSTDGWDAAVNLYERAQALAAIINKAEEASVDISNAVAVYEDEGSTLAQIEAAIKALADELEALSGITGTASNPGDATGLISNPNFDDLDGDGSGDNAGWLGTAPNMKGSGSHGPANVAEVYNATFDTYQELVGMPAGVYGLAASNTFRGSFDDCESGLDAAAQLYATADGADYKSPFDNMWVVRNSVPMAGKTQFNTTASENSQDSLGMTYYIPNDPSAARLYFEKGYYHNAVVFTTTSSSARIGVRNPEKSGTGDNWSIFDTFELKYYGNQGAASYKAWLADNAKLLYANELMATAGYVSQFEATYASANPADAAEANAAYETARKSPELKTLRLNVSLWQRWLAALDNAVQYTTGDYAGLKAASELDGYIGWDADEQKQNPTWTNSEIEASLAQIASMIEAVKAEKMQQITAGTDVTELYIGKEDAAFVNGKGGWTLEGNCNFGAGGAEAYSQTFDLYKIIPSVNAAGVYELKLNGFFRQQRDQTALDMYKRGEQDKTRAWIYMNEVKSYVGCVFDEKVESGVFPNGDQAGDGYWTDSNTDYWYPNTMTSAVECFDHDMYQVKAYGLVANAGDELRIGIKGSTGTDNWMMWDNFKLTFIGYDAATIAPILQEAINNFPDLSSPMGKSVYAKATDLKKEAQNAVYGSDGKAMFDVLQQVWSIDTEINASVAVFKKLMGQIEYLTTMMNESQNDDAVAEVAQYSSDLQDAISDHKYNDEDVPALLDKIKELRTKLFLPAGYADASDLNQIEMTDVVVNPGFDTNWAENEGAWEEVTGVNSTYGWNAEGAGYGNGADNTAALALEFYNKTFDLNQTIFGLPAGWYVVQVSAFERVVNPAYLYANSSEKEIAAIDDADGIDGPAAAVTYFGEGKYINQVKVKVAADGKLTIGIKKEKNEYVNEETGEVTTSGTDWVCLDDWTLTFWGQSEPNIDGGNVGVKGDVNGDGTVDVADISNVITIMADGSNDAAGDVNEDGTVDVADISNIITIMAESARRAKALED